MISKTPLILVAGGRADTNLVVLADRLRARGIEQRCILVGAGAEPRLRIDFSDRTFELDGEVLEPTGFFVRQDVFFSPGDDGAEAYARALNWYQAVRGWAESRTDARLFNRSTTARENNKILNLTIAQDVGLRVPKTVATNDLTGFERSPVEMIQKPVAGGEYTALIGEASGTCVAGPRFVQPRLRRPELRIYRIGKALIAFGIQSRELDYRRTHDVEIACADVPAEIGSKLVDLCDRLQLDFAAADFMLDADGEPNFLEVNSQPMFAAFDRIAGGRLSDAIVDELVHGV